MKVPIYQRFSEVFNKWVLTALAILGSFVGLWKNLNAVITPGATYFLTVIIIFTWISFEVYAKKRGIPWVIEKTSTKLRGLGWGRRISIIAILACLWLPRVVDYATYKEEVPALQLIAGSRQLEFNNTNEIIYGIPTQLNSPSFITTYIQFHLENLSEKTVENVVISLRYPEGSQMAQTGTMKQSVLGEKEEQQLKRRTSTLEGVTFSYLLIDSLGPGKAMILHEPINIPSTMIDSPDRFVTINVNISAKDFLPKDLDLKLRSVMSNSKEELNAKCKELIYKEVVENRKNSSFFRYLRQSIGDQRRTATVVFPAFNLAKNSKGEAGYLSDAMHDGWANMEYSPAPFQYLFH